MRWVVMAGAAVLLGACASVTRGMTEQVQINSSPQEAQARTSMGHVCTTPCTLQFSRKDEFSVLISKPGYHTTEVAVMTRVAGAGAAGFAGNVLLGGVIGMGVDAASGATLEHHPNPVTATLVPLKKGEVPSVIKVMPAVPEPKPDEVNPRT